MNRQIKNITINVTSITIAVIAGLAFMIDRPQKAYAQTSYKTKHSPYQSKIVPIKETALVQAVNIVKISVPEIKSAPLKLKGAISISTDRASNKTQFKDIQYSRITALQLKTTTHLYQQKRQNKANL